MDISLKPWSGNPASHPTFEWGTFHRKVSKIGTAPSCFTSI